MPVLDGAIVRAKRKAEGWTQLDLATEAGVDEGTIGTIEGNAGHNTQRKKAEKIAKALGVPLETLLLARRLGTNLPSPNRYFTGREALLTEIREGFEPGKSVIQVLVGLPGVGKTQVARKYADDARHGYRLVWWVHASQADAIDAALVKLARDLKLPDHGDPNPDVVLQGVRTWLRQNPGWLLVFDGAESPSEILRRIDDCLSEHVLITSCYQEWGNQAIVRQVGVLDPEESIEFLCKRTKDPDRSEAARLAEILGHLPLALEQASAYINRTHTSMASYRKRFRIARPESRPNDHLESVVKTFELALERACSGTPRARELLNLITFLEAEAIPRDLFHDQDALDKAIGQLADYSLIRATPTTLTIHTLHQMVLWARLSQEQLKEWAVKALCLFDSAFPSPDEDDHLDPRSLDLLRHAQRALRHAEELGVATLPQKVSIRLFEALDLDMRDKPLPAKKVGEKLLEATESANDLLYARVVAEYSVILEHLGEHGDALGLLDALLAKYDAQQTLGETYWRARNRQGTALLRLGRNEEATQVFLEVEKSASATSNILSAAHKLGVILLDEGKYAEAKEKFHRCRRERESAPRDHRLAYDYRRLGQACALSGELDEAREWYQKANDVCDEFHFKRYKSVIAEDMQRYKL